MKRCVPLIALGLLLALMPGMTCNTSQQTTAYNTLYSLEKTTVAAYDSYLGAVLGGAVGTNDVPTISHAFNDFQVAMTAAVDVSASGTNGPAPAALEAQSAALINQITTARKGK